MMLDQLVMLLSTDWFKPHWDNIGIDINEAAKTSIQQGCREVVGQILSGAENYYLASFSDERRNKTRSMFESVVHDSGTGEIVRAVITEWVGLSDEEQKATWIYETLTSELLSGHLRGGDRKLNLAIATIMVNARQKYNREPFEFAGICVASQTAWDSYTRGLTPELPTALADGLASVLTARRFELLWRAIRNKLTSAQREELMAWYRRAAKVRAHRDLVPTYLS